MKLLKIISVIFFSFCLFGFNNKKETVGIKQEIPVDFYFAIRDGANDVYNSQYNSFYRNYIEEEKTIKVELTKRGKKKKYTHMLKKVNFFEMPMEFKPTGIININNAWFKQKVIVVYANNTKKSFVSYNYGYTK